MTENDSENCKVLGDFFLSEFTEEPKDDVLPGFDHRCEDELDNFETSKDMVLKKSYNIKVNRIQMGLILEFYRNVNTM